VFLEWNTSTLYRKNYLLVAESFLKFRKQFQLLMEKVDLFVDSVTVLTKNLNCTHQISGFLLKKHKLLDLKKNREKVTIRSCFNASGIHQI